MLRLLASVVMCALIALKATAQADSSPPKLSKEATSVKPDAVKLRVMAALALSKAAREREDHVRKDVTKKEEEKKELAKKPKTLLNYEKAKQEAEQRNLPLYVWVGGVDEETYNRIVEAGLWGIHVQVPSINGDRTQRLVVQKAKDPSFQYWFHDNHPLVTEVKNLVTSSTAKRKTVPTSKTQLNQAQPPTMTAHGPGMHSHKCAACGYEWWHSAASHGSYADHMCPACGNGPQWTQYRSGGSNGSSVLLQQPATIVVAKPAPVVRHLGTTYSNCPT